MYGDISPEELADMKDRIQKLSFPITEPVESIFAKINNLANLARIAKSPLTEQQKIDFEDLILQRMCPYGSYLTKWNERDPIDKTWNAFKQVFCLAQRNLRKTGQLTVANSMNHMELANIVSTGVCQAMESTEHVNMVQNDENNNLQSQLQEMKKMMEQLKTENKALLSKENKNQQN